MMELTSAEELEAREHSSTRWVQAFLHTVTLRLASIPLNPSMLSRRSGAVHAEGSSPCRRWGLPASLMTHPTHHRSPRVGLTGKTLPRPHRHAFNTAYTVCRHAAAVQIFLYILDLPPRLQISSCQPLRSPEPRGNGNNTTVDDHTPPSCCGLTRTARWRERRRARSLRPSSMSTLARISGSHLRTTRVLTRKGTEERCRSILLRRRMRWITRK